ncbi:MAG: hypothetical protein IKT63_00070, partial [Oscillospiraceae bacterium]|nr:hypothetical protein [Oscillospiraceae bacterium]
MSRKLKTALARNIIKVTDENIDDEELIHALLEEEIFVGTESENLSFGEKAADFLAKLWNQHTPRLRQKQNDKRHKDSHGNRQYA